MTGIELYRNKAHRTGENAGQDDADYGPTINTNLCGADIAYPEWCKVTVYRIVGSQRVPYSARVYWLETYATAKRDTNKPNAMWAKRPFGQLEKCAEALALRKGFPDAEGAQPTMEEMAGKSLDIDDEPHARVIEMPRAKSEALPSPVQAETASAEPEAAPVPTGEPGFHDLSDSQKRIVAARGKMLGLDEAALLQKWPRIDKTNITDVLTELHAMADREAAEAAQ
jgi:hypothetical protein